MIKYIKQFGLIGYFKRLFNDKLALFCDLDGTIINTLSGKTFPTNCNDWYIRKEVIKAIKEYHPYYILIVSNQGGIEKGFVNETDFRHKLYLIQEQIQKECPWAVIYSKFCISNDKNCADRKPNPGMVKDLMKGYSLNKRNCLMIGDASGLKGQFSDSDKKCAENAGIRYMDVTNFVTMYSNFNCWSCAHFMPRYAHSDKSCRIHGNKEEICRDFKYNGYDS